MIFPTSCSLKDIKSNDFPMNFSLKDIKCNDFPMNFRLKDIKLNFKVLKSQVHLIFILGKIFKTDNIWLRLMDGDLSLVGLGLWVGLGWNTSGSQ